MEWMQRYYGFIYAIEVLPVFPRQVGVSNTEDFIRIEISPSAQAVIISTQEFGWMLEVLVYDVADIEPRSGRGYLKSKVFSADQFRAFLSFERNEVFAYLASLGERYTTAAREDRERTHKKLLRLMEKEGKGERDDGRW